MKKYKYITLFLISFTIIFYGFIKVASGLPDFFKNKSSFKVFYNTNPFDLQFDVGEYRFYINNKAIENIKSNTIGKIININKSSNIKEFIDDIRTN